MWRITSIAAGVCLAAVGVVAAPAHRPGDAPPPYFPTAVGDKATYRVTVGDFRTEHTETVTDVAKVRDGLRVAVERAPAGGKPVVVARVDVSAKGLSLAQADGVDLDPPVPELRLPAKAGDAWTWEAPGLRPGWPARETAFKVLGEEEVRVPAGTYRAIRVESAVSVGTPRLHRTETWYAPKVGVVKRVVNVGGGESVKELVTFTPAPSSAAEPDGAPDRGGRE